MAEVEYRLLGPVALLRGGVPVSVGGSTGLALLAGLLLSANQPVSSERLAEIVWGEKRPARPRNALHSAVSRLRRVVGGGVLEGSRTGYRLNTDADELDLLRSERLVDAAAAVERRDALREAAAALDQALALWGEEPLGNVDSPALLAQAARLAEKRLVMYEQYADVCLRLGRHAAVVELLPTLVRTQPFRERLVGQLMTALFRSGRQAEALLVYESVRGSLRDELGISPSTRLRDLHVRILQSDPKLGDWQPQPPDPAPSAPTARTADGNPPWRGLRPPPQRLVGRDQELDELCRAVRSGRAVTVVGTAGVGKTSVALKAAERLAAGFRDGVTVVELGWLPASSDDGAARVLDAVLHALDGGAALGRGAQETLAAAVRGQDLLLVLDNAEHVAGACGRAVDLIVRSCPGVKVLTTSRRALGVGVEAVVELPPLDSRSAAELLWLRTVGHRPGLDLNADPEGAAELCRQVGGLPLGVELAALRLRTMSLRALLRRVGRQRGLLAGASGARLPHQHAMDTTLHWSYSLLSRAAQLLLHRLAAFEDPFTLEDAEWAAGHAPLTRDEVAVLLGTLVEHCLVQAERGADGYSYRLLIPVRRFVLGCPTPFSVPVLERVGPRRGLALVCIHGSAV